MPNLSNHEYLNYASVILGIIVMILCLLGDVPKNYATCIFLMMPLLVTVNYISLVWLSDPTQNIK